MRKVPSHLPSDALEYFAVHSQSALLDTPEEHRKTHDVAPRIFLLNWQAEGQPMPTSKPTKAKSVEHQFAVG